MAAAPMNLKVEQVSCCDGCGLQSTADEAEHQGWTLLAVQGRWRCPACAFALKRANDPKPPPAP